MKILKIVPIIFLTVIAVLQLSCDERTPTEDTSSNYTMTMTTQPVAGNDLSGENVGEDILGDVVTTRVSAILKDNDEHAIEEALISFSSKKENSPYGQMDPQSGYTDENGTVTVLFKDPGDAAAFGESKALLRAEYSQNIDVFAQSLIDVYPDTVVWPYSIAISSSINQIFKTSSPQSSTLTIYVYNKLSNPVTSVYVDLSTNVGSFGDAQQKVYTILTDNLGRSTVEFNHNNELGLAIITANYSHEGLNGTQSDSTQVLIGTNYNITLSQYPVSQDSLGNWIIVGEDIVGDQASSRLIATITDNSGNPVQGEQIILSAEAQGNNAGIITTNTNVTNSQGQVFAYFDDDETVYQDLGVTEDFEGVTCTAFIGDLTGENNSVQFSVFTESVWPYQLSLNTDLNEIILDNGATFATLNGRLLNGLSQPVSNVIISFSADRGYLVSQVTTDSNGDYTLIFRDLGEPSDVGLASITGSFNHPGFVSNIEETEYISIVTNYNMTLDSYPVSLNESGNPVLVGEDVAEDNSRTRIVATITDQAGNVVVGQSILFNAEGTGGTDVGTFDAESYTTDSEGKAKAYFLDNGNAYEDQSGTEDFEGVTVTAFIGDETGEGESVQFSVYSESDVWPYQLTLNSSTTEIILDNGQTYATIAGKLLNGLNYYVGSVTLSFSTDRGHINSQDTTDAMGDFSLVFTDLGQPSDVGLASITGSFTHPGFDSTITKTAQVAIVTNYSLALTSYSVSLNDDGNSVVVGEDVAGDNAQTRIVATVTDQAGNFIPGQTIYFNAEVLGDQDVGSFDAEMYSTNNQGKVFAYFLDNGTSHQDQSGTEDFEGVLVTAFIGDETGESESVTFSVYDASDVWPYQLSLNTNVDEITLDNGQTEAVISGRLLNGLNTAVSTVTVSFSADRGYINSQVTTDSNGDYSLNFQDLGEPSDVGLATITGSFTHPGFDSTVIGTEYISIVTNYSLALEKYSVSMNENGNPVLVGEDVSGDNARTRIIATVTDLSGNPVEGQTLIFTANVLENNDVGSFQTNSFTTNGSGKVYAYFLDNETAYQDQSGTQDFEGVTVTVFIGDATGENMSVNFSVYDESSVWPYQLSLNTDVDEITLDNGQTVANITGELLNSLNYPVTGVTLHLLSDKGFIVPEIVTDSTGNISTNFRDQGDQSDVGMASIHCRYAHPGLEPEIVDSVQVFITTHYSITLEQLPVSIDENENNFIVGEDIVGDQAYTLLIATVNDTGGMAVPGVLLNFIITDEDGDDLGSLDFLNQSSDGNGQVQALFTDDGVAHVDIPGSPSFEGVTVKVIYGGEEYQSVQFNVYDSDDVWPYSLFLTTDTDVIHLDAGVTQATVVARLLNGLSNPVKQAQLTYDATLGFISSFGQTDSTGVDTVYFQDLGNPDEVGISNITANYSHPGFAEPISSNTLNISIEDTTFETCAYVTIPPSAVGEIMVSGGGGIESTTISAEVYDDDGILIDIPTEVRFILGPNIPEGAHLENAAPTDTVSAYTNNGIASVSLNSGTAPGPVRITAIVECDSVEFSAVAVPVIIVTGPPYYIEAEWDPSSTEAIGGGLYRVQCSVLVSDRYSNPVEDSTYVYWSIEQVLPCETPDVAINGTSLTFNTNFQDNQYQGVSYTDLTYSTNGIGDEVRVVAYTWGDDLDGDGVYGDSVGTYINDGEGGAVELPYINGGAASVTITTSTTAHDFTMPIPTDSVLVMVSVGVYDYYGNEVINVPVAFSGIGVTNWFEVGFEVFQDVGIEGYGVGDGCFTWRDFGADGQSETLDCGEGNYNHDSFDEDGNIRHWPHYDNELSEPFYDCGIDGLCPEDSDYSEPDSGEGDLAYNSGEGYIDLNENGEYDEGDLCYDYGFDLIDGTGDYGESDGICQPGEQYYDTNGDGYYTDGEPFEDCGFDGLCAEDATYPGPDEGEGDGQWYGYHMEGCGWPDTRVRTDENGIARIIANLPKELCTFAGLSEIGDFSFCTYNQYTATINATLAIPVITQGDPVNIELSRTPFEADEDAANCFE